MENRELYLVSKHRTGRSAITSILRKAGWQVQRHGSAGSALEDISKSGLFLVEDVGTAVEKTYRAMEIHGTYYSVCVFSDVCSASRIMDVAHLGASDYFCLPLTLKVIETRLESAWSRGLQIAKKKTQALEANRLVANLSVRERDILRRYVPGLSNEEVVDTLDLSSRTVEVHRQNIKKRLNVKHFSMAVRIATLAEL